MANQLCFHCLKIKGNYGVLEKKAGREPGYEFCKFVWLPFEKYGTMASNRSGYE